MGVPNAGFGAKIHTGIDVEMHELQAVKVTTGNINDARKLPEWLDQNLRNQDIGSVTAHGAYNTHKRHDAIATCGAQAVTPPRKNSKQ